MAPQACQRRWRVRPVLDSRASSSERFSWLTKIRLKMPREVDQGFWYKHPNRVRSAFESLQGKSNALHRGIGARDIEQEVCACFEEQARKFRCLDRSQDRQVALTYNTLNWATMVASRTKSCSPRYAVDGRRAPSWNLSHGDFTPC